MAAEHVTVEVVLRFHRDDDWLEMRVLEPQSGSDPRELAAVRASLQGARKSAASIAGDTVREAVTRLLGEGGS